MYPGNKFSDQMKIAQKMCLLDCWHVFTIYMYRKLPHPLVTMFFHWSQPFFNSSEISIKPIWSSFMIIGQKLWLLKGSQAFLLHKYKENDTPGSHVSWLIKTVFKLNWRIQETNVLTKFHADYVNKSCVCETQCPLLRRFEDIYLTFDPEGWPWHLTSQNVQLHEIHMRAKYRVAIFNIAKFDLDSEGWPWPFTTQSVQLHDIRMHAKYRVAIFNIAIFDLWPWPWRMTLTFNHSKCAAPWDKHACQISSCYLPY